MMELSIVNQSTQTNQERKLQKNHTVPHFQSLVRDGVHSNPHVWKSEEFSPNKFKGVTSNSLKEKQRNSHNEKLKNYASSRELSLDYVPTISPSPYSSSASSLILNGHSHQASRQQLIKQTSVNGNNKQGAQPPVSPYHTQNKTSRCKCFYDIDPKDKSRLPTVTPEGLSWRRLHMSRAKLKATSTTSELLSGFAMIAMVELQINDDTQVPEWLFIVFSVCTTILVAVHIFALMISTYILPNIDAISKLDICELVVESPHERMKGFIELAWAFSTVLGLFLFLVEVAILCWVKFWDYSFKAAIAATIIVIPVLIIFVLFTVHFYHSMLVHKCNTSVDDMQKLEDMKKRLDEVVVIK